MTVGDLIRELEHYDTEKRVAISDPATGRLSGVALKMVATTGGTVVALEADPADGLAKYQPLGDLTKPVFHYRTRSKIVRMLSLFSFTN
jgi:hypothetical protein